MKLLLVNGNTTEAVTNHVVAEARRHASPGTEITGVTASFGASIVTAEPENTIAALAVLELLAAHYRDHDAAILAISFDSGLFAARELVPIPVLGMTEAALLSAAEPAGRIAVILFGEASLPLYQAQFARYPTIDRIAAIEVIGVASVANYLTAADLDVQVIQAIEALHRRGDVASVVICGAAMAGMAGRLQARSPLRLFDGIAEAVRRAEELVRAGVRPSAPRAGLSRSAQLSGLSPALAALFAARNG